LNFKTDLAEQNGIEGKSKSLEKSGTPNMRNEKRKTRGGG